ncbi:MAG: hypothetical protein K2L88_04850 [Clostridiales bacterium]|nr:hypothetical protein [Clostridiales bacterium]
MGRWAMSVSASDEYQEVKDEFFKQFYYTEKTLEEIEQSILEYYQNEYSSFDANDGVWHDVYFALADCEWKCGNLSARLLLKVEDIIKNKLDLLYMESLMASPHNLETREKVLEKFLDKLIAPNEKPIKRKLKKTFVNPFKTGDVFQYRYKGEYFGGVILQIWDSDKSCDIIYKDETLHYCIAVSEIRSASTLNVEQIENSKVLCAEWIMPFCLPKTSGFEILGNVADRLSGDYRNYLGAHMTRYGMSMSGRFNEKLIEIISGTSNMGNNYSGHLKKYGIFDKTLAYLFDINNIVRTKR